MLYFLCGSPKINKIFTLYSFYPVVFPTQYNGEVWFIVQLWRESKNNFEMYLLLYALFWERNVHMNTQAGDIRTKT